MCLDTEELIVFILFFYGGYHCVHPFLNLADLRMHFLDEVVFELGQLFYAFALRVKLIQQIKLKTLIIHFFNITVN